MTKRFWCGQCRWTKRVWNHKGYRTRTRLLNTQRAHRQTPENNMRSATAVPKSQRPYKKFRTYRRRASQTDYMVKAPK